jgi:hypothetical protein
VSVKSGEAHHDPFSPAPFSPAVNQTFGPSNAEADAGVAALWPEPIPVVLLAASSGPLPIMDKSRFGLFGAMVGSGGSLVDPRSVPPFVAGEFLERRLK